MLLIFSFKKLFINFWLKDEFNFYRTKEYLVMYLKKDNQTVKEEIIKIFILFCFAKVSSKSREDLSPLPEVK